MQKWNDFRAKREIMIDKYISRRKIQSICETHIKYIKIRQIIKKLSSNVKKAAKLNQIKIKSRIIGILMVSQWK